VYPTRGECPLDKALLLTLSCQLCYACMKVKQDWVPHNELGGYAYVPSEEEKKWKPFEDEVRRSNESVNNGGWWRASATVRGWCCFLVCERPTDLGGVLDGVSASGQSTNEPTLLPAVLCSFMVSWMHNRSQTGMMPWDCVRS